MQFIDLKAQQELIRSDIEKSIQDVLNSGQYIMGKQVGELEEALSEYTGAPHTIGCSSGTDALVLALLAIGIKAGDEVITTPFTFFATTEVIALLGAKCIFVDIEEDSYNIDANLIEEKITSKTKAIIPVSLFGQCADMEKINLIANKHNVIVIEDAAQSFGAEYKNKKSGNLSTIACTSFFPAKPLGCYGDGGACFTDNEDLALKMRQLLNHGQTGKYIQSMIGINGRLDTIQAAILLNKMTIFPDEVKKRAEIGKRYSDQLKDFVKVPTISNDCTHVYAQYTLAVDNRDQFQKNLTERKIPTGVYYPIPLHKQPIFEKEYEGRTFEVTEKVCQKVISLPMHPYLDKETQDQVIEACKQSL